MMDFILEAWVSASSRRRKSDGCLVKTSRGSQAKDSKCYLLDITAPATRAPTCAWRKCCGSSDTFLVQTALISA